jgi:hypothetical protein
MYTEERTAPSAASESLALAHAGPSGELMFLLRDLAGIGNLMRTPDPRLAKTWPSTVELKDWVEGLPDGSKNQLAGRPLLIVPITTTAGEPVMTFELKVTAPETEDAPAEYQPALIELQGAKAKKARGRKSTKGVPVA